MDKIKWFVAIISCGIILNIFLLYYFLFDIKGEIKNVKNLVDNKQQVSTLENEKEVPQDYQTKESSESATCPFACSFEIDKLVGQAISKITPVASQNEKIPVLPVGKSSISEYSIFIGSGSVKTQEWSDVAGLIVEIDSTKYKSVKTVKFEASLRIPSGVGRVFARLYNKTDQHPVWFSEINSDSSASVFLQSEEITLDSGKKSYVVQMKSTIGAEALIDSARVKIAID